MEKSLTPHFSRKVLLLSLIFLLANLGIYGLKFLAVQPNALESVAPKLVSATVEDIEVKSPYDEAYMAAQDGQEIFSGTLVKTGEAEFAELVLGENIIRLDELTEVRLVKNNFMGPNGYVPDSPRLVFELLAGSIWVDAFDLIEVRSVRSVSRLDHGIGIFTYSEPINRLMVVTGSVDLQLLGEDGEALSDFVVPLHNQITFVDSQITSTYAALKPSKLKKELKMTPISASVLADEWVARNANDFEAEKKAYEDSLIQSDLAYRIRSSFQDVLSYVTFIPEARRNLATEEAKTIVGYLLGGVQEEGDLELAAKLIDEFKALVEKRRNDPQLQTLITETLFDIEYSRCGTPTYLLKEYLMQEVASREGPHVFDICLTDIRRSFYEEDPQATELVAEKWIKNWQANLVEANLDEFDRQSQILNHTILSYVDSVTPKMLEVFDESGVMKMAYASDPEEARYEVISDRLQITASLVVNYRYNLAKQYLKNSYLNLDIENLGEDLPSTQIFLENGKQLAQRIEYAEKVLHGAAEPIDETKFMEYSQTVRRDEALSEDLRKFFELDKGEVVVETGIQAPTAAQVAERFLDARINVNYADISLQPSSGFYYSIVNARLIDRGPNNEPLSFDASYDYVSNSVTDVKVGDKKYQGGFTLSDIVTLLKGGGELESRIPTPRVEEGIELLITDQEKIEAQEGQAIAQDVARQLAYSQLTANGIVIPEAKFDIQIMDELNLNQFHIDTALIPRPDSQDAISIQFDYHSGKNEATNIRTEEGVNLLEKVPVNELADKVIEKIAQVEKEVKVVGDFNELALEYNCSVDPGKIRYTSEGMLAITNLEFSLYGLKMSGTYNPDSREFTSVTNDLLTSQNISLGDYLKLLVEEYVVAYMQSKGYPTTASQILTGFPYEEIEISQLQVGNLLLDFKLDINENRALNVSGNGLEAPVSEINVTDLPTLVPES